MKMRDRLARVGAAVGNDAETAGKAGFGSDFLYCVQAGGNLIIVQLIDFRDRSHMLFRNHQDMEGGPAE